MGRVRVVEGECWASNGCGGQRLSPTHPHTAHTTPNFALLGSASAHPPSALCIVSLAIADWKYGLPQPLAQETVRFLRVRQT